MNVTVIALICVLCLHKKDVQKGTEEVYIVNSQSIFKGSVISPQEHEFTTYIKHQSPSVLTRFFGNASKGLFVQLKNPDIETVYIAWEWVVLFFLVLILVLTSLWFRQHYRKRKIVQLGATLSRINAEQASAIAASLTRVMKEQKPFLNPDLSLAELATLLDTSDKNLSYYLNHNLETTFYDYLNHERITEFLERQKSEAFKNYSTVGIALESGFKSKSSFYRAFKKEKGRSPKDYLSNPKKTER
ncbi:MAG: AraC family transcriptional regulator [Bacteroidota bacterium]